MKFNTPLKDNGSHMGCNKNIKHKYNQCYVYKAILEVSKNIKQKHFRVVRPNQKMIKVQTVV